jgi:UDP-N-acetylglucosamine diphosphorylase / glucose-1-phosphate thymidylyltransferase / UDP-N-acetylgalactosamine diphosphorylase / glucosamine-1-phosphate N-acetyltransferase / galactosamine-1-phosphate N-acetyltransferase
MRAIILAAGKGLRMRPLTDSRPKPLVLLKGKPLIEHTFAALPDSVDDVILVVGYKGEMLQAHLGDGFLGKHITYVTQTELGGTAPAIRQAEHLLSGAPFLTFYADDYYEKRDIEKLLEHQYAMLLSTVQDPRMFGVVELDQRGRVVSLEEKPALPKSNTVSTGVFILDDAVFAYDAPPHPVTGEQYLADMVMGLSRDEDLYGVLSDRWLQIGTPEDLARAETLLKQSE